MFGEDEDVVLYEDTLKDHLKKKVPVRSYIYEACINGCMMFQKDDIASKTCKYCNESRYQKEGEHKPVNAFQMLSIGDQIALSLSQSSTRELMKYRSQYQSEPGVYKDTFDGERYKDLLKRNFFRNENDVALMMQIDGFTPSDNANNASLTMVQFVNMNIPLELRYTSIHKYLLVVTNELLDIKKNI